MSQLHENSGSDVHSTGPPDEGNLKFSYFLVVIGMILFVIGLKMIS